MVISGIDNIMYRRPILAYLLDFAKDEPVTNLSVLKPIGGIMAKRSSIVVLDGLFVVVGSLWCGGGDLLCGGGLLFCGVFADFGAVVGY